MPILDHMEIGRKYFIDSDDVFIYDSGPGVLINDSLVVSDSPSKNGIMIKTSNLYWHYIGKKPSHQKAHKSHDWVVEHIEPKLITKYMRVELMSIGDMGYINKDALFYNGRSECFVEKNRVAAGDYYKEQHLILRISNTQFVTTTPLDNITEYSFCDAEGIRITYWKELEQFVSRPSDKVVFEELCKANLFRLAEDEEPCSGNLIDLQEQFKSNSQTTTNTTTMSYSKSLSVKSQAELTNAKLQIATELRNAKELRKLKSPLVNDEAYVEERKVKLELINLLEKKISLNNQLQAENDGLSEVKYEASVIAATYEENVRLYTTAVADEMRGNKHEELGKEMLRLTAEINNLSKEIASLNDKIKEQSEIVDKY